MTEASFVHLHLHTAYTLCEGAIKTGGLAKKIAALKMPAVAMTDTNTLGGAPAFTKDVSGAGVQPIAGIEMTLKDEILLASKTSDGKPTAATIRGTIVLLAKDETGFKNLIKLTSDSYIATTDGADPVVSLAELGAANAGIIVLTGGSRSPINKALAAGNLEMAGIIVERLKADFGDRLYVEIVRHKLADERVTEPKLLELAEQFDLPIVATNDCFFLEASGIEAQDALVCMKDTAYLTQDDRRRGIRQAWVKPAKDMRELFADLPEACDNTVEIAKRCAAAFKKSKPILPPFPGLEGRTEEQALREFSKDGLAARLQSYPAVADNYKNYYDRLDYELDVIAGMGFPGYFLIVADFIGWAKDNGIPVGPGRGSGAGSIVAWALRITDLDPIEYELLFERFLNPERVSMPDFDIDFCQGRREEVIDYVKRRYGIDRVGQIGTIGKLKARAAVQSIGRVLQMPYPVVNRITNQIPDNPNDPKTLKESMQIEPLAGEIQRSDMQVKRMFELALGIEGLHKNLSTHAAGVVIADRPLLDLVPLFRDDKGKLATQYDMKGVEDAGLVKFDFLGLKTLDIVQGAIDMLAEQSIKIDFHEIGVDDKATYEMLARGESFAVFQLESAGMRKAILNVGPDTIDDIIALNALYRPGPMQNIPTYADVKHGLKRAEYLHPLMKKVLEETNGIIVYQEQVMDLGKRLAGYSLGGADLLRRAMGKKIQAEMDAQRSVFVDGCSRGWIEFQTDDGRTIHMHALHKVKTVDGKSVALEEAIAQGLEISI